MENCGHLCKQICSLKHECDKCLILVNKKIFECGHIVKIRCDTEPIREYCTSICEKILSCGHKCTKKCQILDCGKCMTKINVRSPCVHKSNVTVNCSDPKWTYLIKCAIPCGEILDCGHKCNGSCGSCLGGLLHQSCVQKCDRMLFCGHKCSVPCSKQCEPCKEICQNECYHSKCKQICSEPCADCKEKCKISCRHSICTRLCHELCDRKPCNEPCGKKLKCKHDCIGLCGEKCPPLCRICHQNQVSEIFFGDEDEPDARFIYLEECSHVVEVSGMDEWINTRYSDENNNSSNSIQLPQCPKCKTSIRKSKRYANVIKTQLKAINEIKLKHFGDKTENKRIFQELKKHLEEYLLTKEDKFMDVFVIENINRVLKKDLSFNSLAAIQNTWNIYLRIKKIQKIVQENGFNDFVDQKEHFKFEIEKIFDSLKTPRNELLMLKEGQKLREINIELDRVANIVELERMTNLALKIPDLPNEALTILSRLEDLLVKNVIRFDKVRDEVKNFLNELASLLKTELSKEEKSMIVKAIGLSPGHWYKCPNGHVYCIGECGGAMEKTKCPDCNAEIGGFNHQIVTGNQLASEMDGASRPAWPTAFYPSLNLDLKFNLGLDSNSNLIIK
ncbi:NFX1-type zinc finger-containing 1 [Brachionus plicatilis]|uniref:NFX1-type zinc finger-containing 1 n=1 Tax=Brachionus plicatilis TaxID=10195 RepID=A0A3M7R4L2_BRAPC|nr:NFX1-type zinc finger-containing 1 [Brachionus plicatilis]